MPHELLPWVADWWKPIETAPKDGLEILTFAPGEGGGIAVGYYATEELNDTVHETWRDDGYIPTHWMPMPPPPRDSALEQNARGTE